MLRYIKNMQKLKIICIISNLRKWSTRLRIIELDCKQIIVPDCAVQYKNCNKKVVPD